MDVQMFRREFLGLSAAALSIGGLGGCSLLGHSKTTDSIKPNPFIIDAHCHIFNAADIPVEGFVKYVALGKFKSTGIPTLAGIIIRVFANNLAPNYTQENKRLDQLLSAEALTTKGFEALKEQWKQEDADKQQQATDYFNKEINDIMIMEKWNQKKKSKSPLSTKEQQEKAEHLEFIKEVKRLTQLDQKSAQLNPINWFKRLIGIPSTIGRYLLWALKMLRFRYQQMEDLADTYPDVKTFTAALVDFDRWFASDKRDTKLDSKVTIAQQVKLNQKLSQFIQQRHITLHTFVPFDPLRDVENSTESDKNVVVNQILRYVIEKKAIGVKLYPPMGFHATANSGKTFHRSDIDNLGEKLDQSLDTFFRKCQHYDIPIMSHTAHSNDNKRWSSKGGYADPQYWLIVLKKYNNLRINFSHFAKHSPLGNPWSLLIREMLINYPNTYADISHLDKIHEPAYFREYKVQLKSYVKNANSQARFKVLDKLIYGSDWVMLAKEKVVRHYLVCMADLFQEAFGETAKDKFLGRNAQQFLNSKPVHCTQASSVKSNFCKNLSAVK